ncbi:hypothetical protein GQ457_17G025320 [Hibiscus cannabinus]
MLNKEEGFNRWDCASNFNLFMGGGGACLPHQANTNRERMVTNAYRGGCEWAALETATGPSRMELVEGMYMHRILRTEAGEMKGLSADLIAAQAVFLHCRFREDAEIYVSDSIRPTVGN